MVLWLVEYLLVGCGNVCLVSVMLCLVSWLVSVWYSVVMLLLLKCEVCVLNIGMFLGWVCYCLWLCCICLVMLCYVFCVFFWLNLLIVIRLVKFSMLIFFNWLVVLNLGVIIYSDRLICGMMVVLFCLMLEVLIMMKLNLVVW